MSGQLRAEHVRVTRGATEVLSDVSLAVVAGQVTALVGPNGAGKSTLLWLLAGLLDPARGRIVGERESMGVAFQPDALWEHLSVWSHLAMVLRGTGMRRSARRERIDEVMEQFDLESLRKRKPHTLSSGQRQRLALARAFVGKPAWLLLDEPLAHLDGWQRQEAFCLLREALAHTAAGVLWATHSGLEAMRIADRMAVLIDGRIAQEGSPREVYMRPACLRTARLLGMACEVRFGAEGDVRICRPEEVHFRPSERGRSVVLRCEPLGHRYLLTIRAGPEQWVALHDECVLPGQIGEVAIDQQPLDGG